MASSPSGHPEAERHLPLKAVVFHILLALVEGPLHGYGILQAVRERSEGRVRLQTGPLYRHLTKLMDGGLVGETSTRPEEDDARRSAYYRLSPLGRAVVSAEARRLAGLVSVTEKLGLIEGRAGE